LERNSEVESGVPDSETPENKRHDECNRKDDKKVLSSRQTFWTVKAALSCLNRR
jgi:hypothetical protein